MKKYTLFAQCTHDPTDALKEAGAARKTVKAEIQSLMDLKRKVDSMDIKDGVPSNHPRTPRRRHHDQYRNGTSHSHAAYPGYHQTNVPNTPQLIIVPVSSVQHFTNPNPRSCTHNRPPLKFKGSKKATESNASTKKLAK
jgi:hypothetical protein